MSDDDRLTSGDEHLMSDHMMYMYEHLLISGSLLSHSLSSGHVHMHMHMHMHMHTHTHTHMHMHMHMLHAGAEPAKG